MMPRGLTDLVHTARRRDPGHCPRRFRSEPGRAGTRGGHAARDGRARRRRRARSGPGEDASPGKEARVPARAYMQACEVSSRFRRQLGVGPPGHLAHAAQLEVAAKPFDVAELLFGVVSRGSQSRRRGARAPGLQGRDRVIAVEPREPLLAVTAPPREPRPGPVSLCGSAGRRAPTALSNPLTVAADGRSGKASSKGPLLAATSMSMPWVGHDGTVSGAVEKILPWQSVQVRL